MNAIELDKRIKLKKMRRIATGLLIAMTVIYFISKKYESYSFLISCIAAFSEASMVGALADWFAVVALFRHPLGLSWIPHTAIIQQNKDRIGDSLSGFVVENFFTEEILRNKLKEVRFSENVLRYLRENREAISKGVVKHIPGAVELIYKEGQLSASIHAGLKTRLQNTALAPYVSKLLATAVSSELHIPLMKQMIQSAYTWVAENKEETLKIMEGVNKTFSLPFVGDLAHRSIVKALAKLMVEVESGVLSDLSTELLYGLPGKIVDKFENSEDLRGKIEDWKNDFLESEVFQEFVQEQTVALKNSISTYSMESGEELSSKLAGILEGLVEDLQSTPLMSESLNLWLQDTVIRVVSGYKEEIGKLISDTVKNWPMEDMVEKLEVQVGGDLQYIRINGTVIGGLAGLVIHLISYWL